MGFKYGLSWRSDRVQKRFRGGLDRVWKVFSQSLDRVLLGFRHGLS